MKILVTGGAGYLGSVLVPKLLARGHQVRVVDVGYFGLAHTRSLRGSIEVIREDVCRAASDSCAVGQWLDDCDAVIHLAAISNDPSAELNPELTERVNLHATATLAEGARKRGLKFVFSSSCSVYGEAEGEIDEEGLVNPLTTYAMTKVRAERVLRDLATGDWMPVILRNGTLFGYSPRMRFDLVINIFALYGALYNEIKVFGDGRQWRPYLHVNDCARAFVFFVEAPSATHICYNVAAENLRVTDVAEIFQTLNPLLKVTHLDLADVDRRDYRVSTVRLRDEGFETHGDVRGGSETLIEAIVTGAIQEPEAVFYRNAKWLKELSHLETKNHLQVMTLLESMAQVGSPFRR